MRSRWRSGHPITARARPPDDGGDARRRARKEHTARQAERARQRRETDRRDSGDARARAPRATDCDQREQGTRARPPAPAKITARVRPTGARRGEGGSALRARRGKGDTPPRNRAHNPAPPPTKRRNSRQRQRPEARRGRETGRGSRTTARRGDAKQSAASGQAAQADDGETASGRGSRPTPPHATAQNATTPADGDTAARRTATAQAGRTGRESPAAAPKPPAQKKSRTERHSTRATDAEAASHGGHGRQHARTPGGGTLRERADGQRAESATGQRQIGGRARDSPDKATEGSGRSGGAPTAQPNAGSAANAESRPPDRGPPLRPL